MGHQEEPPEICRTHSGHEWGGESAEKVSHPSTQEVAWDEPADPARPVSWSRTKKWWNMGIISYLTFLTPLTSSIVAPAQGLVMKEFGSTNRTLASFVVSIYLVGFAVGPLFLAPLSEIYGRLRVYQVGTLIFTVWNIAGALSPNVGALLVFRLFAGISGSSPVTLGAGSVADMFAREERGVAMSIYGLGPLLGPVIGPIAGGYLSEAQGWRWSGVAVILVIFVLSESYEPVLLRQKANRVRNETGSGAVNAGRVLKLDSKKVSVVFGYLYLLFTTVTEVYETTYHFSQGATGLVYIGIGVGALIGISSFGAVSDRIQNRLIARNNGQPEPEFRLPPLIPGSFLIPIGLFWYGWSAQMHVHWIMPIIGLSWVGCRMIATLLPIQAYLVDAFGEYAASAIAANTVVRSIVGAFLPLAGPSMYAKLGLGWGNSLLGFVTLCLLPVPVVFYFYGKKIRMNSRYQVSA
ncbi:major facilitator superfamily domain-containing protein [Aspergillus pseudonomiae]|uniref:Major facilitator superfamily domain-containing protein n=1 Tax=Aspergillus pseudonomiae TaxID=1506151 RepID=A0A5N7DS53_9EURO|nr:major facilitator superfamily domain-containing protein [Aspergillus pseudonomiae]KAE8409115.1 major facilitator superfamily domain-containing protein [Aspergillus pseudonomiae]